MNKPTHVLLWSGGFDSTAILINMFSKPDEYRRVRVIGCGLKNAGNYAEDKEARLKISGLLKLKETPHIDYVEQEIDATSLLGIQSPIWAWLSASNVSPDVDKTDMVYGFIRGDDFWHYRHSFEQTVINMVEIGTFSTVRGPKVDFSYPLEWKYKKDFINWYLHYPEVFSALSWGGDTVTIKAKEREELEFLYKEITFAHKLGDVKEKGAAKPKEETEAIKENCSQDCACL